MRGIPPTEINLLIVESEQAEHDERTRGDCRREALIYIKRWGNGFKLEYLA